MANLKEIATTCLRIAKVQPDNIEYGATLAKAGFLFKSSYAKRIRDDMNKGRPQDAYLLSYPAELIRDKELAILRTKNKVYTPIRGNSYNPFYSIGSDDGRIVLTYVQKQFAHFYTHLHYLNNTVSYYYSNSYIYIHNNIKLSSIEITSAFELPFLIQIGNDELQKLETGDELMMDFPCPSDMMNSIVAEVATLLMAQQAKQ